MPPPSSNSARGQPAALPNKAEAGAPGQQFWAPPIPVDSDTTLTRIRFVMRNFLNKPNRLAFLRPPCQIPVFNLRRGFIQFLLQIGIFRVIPAQPANDELPRVLAERLAAVPAGAIEREIVISWARRDPVDAAMDASVLLHRLKLDGDQIRVSPDLRRHVIEVQRAWTRDHPPGVYLPAAERLLEHMNTWADAVIQEAIAGDIYFSVHP